jgi:hypothetical protein
MAVCGTWQGPRVGGKGGWTDLGFGFDTPDAQDLVNAYEAGDKRKAATIIAIDNSGKHIGTTLFDGFRIPSSDSVQNLYLQLQSLSQRKQEHRERFLGNRDQETEKRAPPAVCRRVADECRSGQ